LSFCRASDPNDPRRGGGIPARLMCSEAVSVAGGSSADLATAGCPAASLALAGNERECLGNCTQAFALATGWRTAARAAANPSLYPAA
jgi:hypothetical protein